MSINKVFGDPRKAKVLVIGHDPRLRGPDTIAEYCFFADYFFRPIPKNKPELAKYELAQAVFSYVGWLTSYNYLASEFMLTNLCNRALEHAPEGKTVYIPEIDARQGIATVRALLAESQIKLIISMSQQVNFWLQKLGLYFSTTIYLEKSEPKIKGIEAGYYEPIGKSPFLDICGKKYYVDNIPIFPVLHVKQFPFRGPIKANYEKAHYACISEIKKL